MKYQVIYADPPWKLKAGPSAGKYRVENGVQVWDSSGKTRDLDYPTMAVNEICALPIRNICYKDAHLYLWATNKYLPEAFNVIKSWGFKYSTTIVWAKNTMGGGLGGTHRINTEFLLFATRGNLKAIGYITGTWHHVKRDYENGYPRHSKKPDYFRKLIEKVSPGPYIELFARKQSPGWDVFGNEVENSIVLPAPQTPYSS